MGGGCCDCGDDQAVRPQGFCVQHSGAQQEQDPLASLPDDVNASARAILAELAQHLATVIQGDATEADARNAELLSFGQWLKHMCEQGEPFRRHVALAFAHVDSTENLKATASKPAPLAVMLTKHTTVPAAVQKVWHDVWLSLIADPWFKKQVLQSIESYCS